ncbi:MAG TPA: hypothetical protein VIZ65_07975 [Cellvibrionaceae bacterium]
MGRLRVTQAKKPTGKNKPGPQEAFAKLWKQVQKEQLLLEQLPAQIQQFYNLYNERCGRLEALYCELQRDEIHLLLTHWPRKSLRDRERLVLAQYILSTFTELKNNPFRSFDLAALEQTIHNILLPEDDDAEQTDDLFAGEEKSRGEQGKDDNASDAEEFLEDEEPDDFFDEYFGSSERTQNDTANELFNATSLNKMFRQLSKVLHPDLEQDEEQKKYKHELMSQLLVARDKHDVGAIVALYSQHIGGDGAQFAPEDFPRLTLLLKKQLRDVQKEKQQLAHQSGLPGLVYYRFHHKNAARQKNLLRERESLLQQINEDIEYSLAANATVKNLKNFLADWAEEQMESVLFDFDEL